MPLVGSRLNIRVRMMGASHIKVDTGVQLHRLEFYG